MVFFNYYQIKLQVGKLYILQVHLVQENQHLHRKFVKEYKKIWKDREVYLFSALKEDESLDEDKTKAVQN
jgi:hypothetical protein